MSTPNPVETAVLAKLQALLAANPKTVAIVAFVLGALVGHVL